VTLLHIVEWLAEEDTRALTKFNAAEYRRHLANDAEQRLRGLVADDPERGQKSRWLSTLDALITRFFEWQTRNPPTSSSWARRAEAAWNSPCSAPRRSRSYGVPRVRS
jgi:hypothetical protein